MLLFLLLVLDSSDVHFKLGVFCALLCEQVVVVVTARCLFRLVHAAGGVWFERPGDSWDIRHFGRRTSQRRCPTLQEELPIVNYSGTSRCSAEQSPSWSRGVVLGHVSSIVDGNPPDSRDIPASSSLTSR